VTSSELIDTTEQTLATADIGLDLRDPSGWGLDETGVLDNTIVREAYEAILRRSPSPDEYLEALESGIASPLDYAQHLAGGSEAQAVTAPLVRLYEVAFGRSPDADGLDHWAGVMRAGSSLSDIAAFFVASDEFAARFAALGNELSALIDALYESALGRVADEAGKNGWLNSDLTIADILVGISQSAEYVMRANTDLTDFLGESAGTEIPVGIIEGGEDAQDELDVIAGFVTDAPDLLPEIDVIGFATPVDGLDFGF